MVVLRGWRAQVEDIQMEDTKLPDLNDESSSEEEQFDSVRANGGRSVHIIA